MPRTTRGKAAAAPAAAADTSSKTLKRKQIADEKTSEEPTSRSTRGKPTPEDDTTTNKLAQLAVAAAADGAANDEAAAAVAAAAGGGQLTLRRMQWDAKFEELQEFHQEHGHCDTKKTEQVNKYRSLTKWIQRQQIKLGDKTLSEDQTKRLVDLGVTPLEGDAAIAAEAAAAASGDEEDSNKKPEAKKDGGDASTSQRLKQWDAKYDQLKEFQEKNGHCNVPKRAGGYDSLASWVQRQRTKVFDTSSSCNLSVDQKTRLLELGLEKEVPADTTPASTKKRKKDEDGVEEPAKKKAATTKKSGTAAAKKAGEEDDKQSFRMQQWEKKFEKVKEFHTEHGHCNIGDAKSDDPKQMLEYKSLWNWVKYQRPRLAVSDHPSLNNDQRQRLLDLGITPEKPSDKPEKDAEKWEKKFELLQEFQKEHGHCNVPDRLKDDQTKYVSLKKWIRLQREHLRANDPELTEERRERLKNLGFQEKAPASGEGLFDATFQRRLEELTKYKEEHGNVDVPSSSSLGKWTQSIRRHYHKRERGEEGSLLKLEQVASLTDIGFTFVTGTPRPRTIEDSVAEYIAFFKKNNRFPIRRASDDSECRLHNAAGRWREKRNLFQQGIKKHDRLGTCEIPQKLIDDLDAINFRWTTIDRKKAGPPGDWAKQPWETKLKLLKDYMDEHNGKAPVNTYPGLGSFVAGIRKQYRDMQKGNRSTLSDERYKQLSEIGFDFNSPKPGRRWHKKEDDTTKDESKDDGKAKSEGKASSTKTEGKTEASSEGKSDKKDKPTKKERTTRSAAASEEESKGLSGSVEV